MRFFNAHHVLNAQDKEDLMRLGCKNVFHIPNGKDTEFFRPLRRNLKKQSKFNVLFVGRLTFDKGVDVLIKVMQTLDRDPEFNEKIVFRIAGDGPMLPSILKLAKSYPNVEYLGYLAHTELRDIYAKSNLLMLPSRREGFPHAVLEAQSCGLPVVVSNIAGSTDAIVNNETGVATEVGNPKAFASKIVWYYKLWKKDVHEYTRICNNARRNAVENFDWDKILKKLDHMFKVIKQASQN